MTAHSSLDLPKAAAAQSSHPPGHPHPGPQSLGRRMLAPALTSAITAGAALGAHLIGRGVLPGLPCPTHAVFGLYCPLCGGTRAVAALTNGDLSGALVDNALVVVATPLLTVWWVWWVVRSRAGKPANLTVPRWVRWVLLLAIVVFAVVRNLPPMRGVLAP